MISLWCILFISLCHHSHNQILYPISTRIIIIIHKCALIPSSDQKTMKFLKIFTHFVQFIHFVIALSTHSPQNVVQMFRQFLYSRTQHNSFIYEFRWSAASDTENEFRLDCCCSCNCIFWNSKNKKRIYSSIEKHYLFVCAN